MPKIRYSYTDKYDNDSSTAFDISSVYREKTDSYFASFPIFEGFNFVYVIIDNQSDDKQSFQSSINGKPSLFVDFSDNIGPVELSGSRNGDVLRPAFHYLCASQRHLLHLCHPPDGHQLDHGRDQRDRHHPQPACPRHDLDENAAVRLDLADYRVPADCSDAGAGGRGDHDADGHPLRHQLLQCRRWR